MLTYVTGSLFCASERWEPDLKKKLGARFIKKQGAKFSCYNLRLGAYLLCVSEHWEPDFSFSKEPDLFKIEEPKSGSRNFWNSGS